MNYPSPQIMADKKSRSVLEKIEKLISISPDVKTIHLSAKDYDYIINKCIHENMKDRCLWGFWYKAGYLVLRYPSLPGDICSINA